MQGPNTCYGAYDICPESLQVNLKRKHWDAQATEEARAHKRCKQVFLQQMHNAEQAADEGAMNAKKQTQHKLPDKETGALRLQVCCGIAVQCLLWIVFIMLGGGRMC